MLALRAPPPPSSSRSRSRIEVARLSRVTVERVMSSSAFTSSSVTAALSVMAVRLMLAPAVISFVPPAPLRSMEVTLFVAVRLPLVAVRSTLAARSTRLKF